MLSQQINQVDLVIEVLDARAPRAKNPLLEKICSDKKKNSTFEQSRFGRPSACKNVANLLQQ